MLLFGAVPPSFAADLQKFPNAKLLNNTANDGDSFLVETAGRTFHLRLYFVDCPETSTRALSDAQRVREQTRYFGLPDANRLIHFGNQAKAFVEGVLAKPFTVHTAFANAGGRSSEGRVYGFVTTADGDDLASQLVKNGYARNFGVGRETPDGTSRDEMTERLRDFETSAALKHVGVWSESNPDLIAKLRAKQRSEVQELKELQSPGKKAPSPQNLLDLNTATNTELMSIKGIGPVLAGRIITGRPYKTVNDLLKVNGIGKKRLENMRPYFVVVKE